MSYLKRAARIGGVAGVITAAGSGALLGPDAVRYVDGQYRAGVQAALNSQRINVQVPKDGSADFDKLVKAEAGDFGFFATQGFRSVVEREMVESLGPDWHLDTGENVYWTHRLVSEYNPHTERVERYPGRFSNKGGMPNGATVTLRDRDGDNSFGGLPGKKQTKLMRKNELRNVMANHGR